MREPPVSRALGLGWFGDGCAVLREPRAGLLQTFDLSERWDWIVAFFVLYMYCVSCVYHV